MKAAPKKKGTQNWGPPRPHPVQGIGGRGDHSPGPPLWKGLVEGLGATGAVKGLV